MSQTDTVPLAPPAARISGASLQQHWGQAVGGMSAGRLGSVCSQSRACSGSEGAVAHASLSRPPSTQQQGIRHRQKAPATGLPAEGHAKHGADVQVLGGQQRGLVLQHAPHLDLHRWRGDGAEEVLISASAAACQCNAVMHACLCKTPACTKQGRPMPSAQSDHHTAEQLLRLGFSEASPPSCPWRRWPAGRAPRGRRTARRSPCRARSAGTAGCCPRPAGRRENRAGRVECNRTDGFLPALPLHVFAEANKHSADCPAPAHCYTWRAS